MKLTVLLSILVAVSTTAYFSGRIYLLLAAHQAQAISAEQRQKDFFSNQGRELPWPQFKNKGLY